MKKYFATLGGVRVEISKERAEQIKRLQALIRAKRAKDSTNDAPPIVFDTAKCIISECLTSKND